MASNLKENLSSVKVMLINGGYTGEPFATAIKETLGAAVELAKRSELHKFIVIPNVGLLNVLLPGLKNVVVMEKL